MGWGYAGRIMELDHEPTAPTPAGRVDSPAGDRPRAVVVAVGDELVLGEKLDSNSQWLADRLTAAGLSVVEHRTLPDDRRAIAGAIAELARRFDAVVVGGGLGPTADDLTRAALADALGALAGHPEPLVQDAQALSAIEAVFARQGRPMPPTNAQQAYRPASARCLPNAMGTAPGLLARPVVDGRTRLIACLPGPPVEMRAMFESQLAGVLSSLPGSRALAMTLVLVFGLGESELAERLADLMHREHNPQVGTTASAGVVACRVRADPSRPVRGPYAGQDLSDAVEQAVAIIESRCAGHVACRGLAEPAQAVLAEAAGLGVQVVTAESCTGGLLGRLLTDPPGSSRAYAGGWVTYSNQMKQDQLGVPRTLLETVGAVSGPVALAMARGALERSGAGLALSITGIAGPDGGTSEKPVGTVWIAGVMPDRPAIVRCFRFPGDRGTIRRWSAHTALFIGLLAMRGQTDVPLLRQVSQMPDEGA
ncbi:MAG: CinA-like protein [Phycisphaerales bacterium]|nr:MAG: CinA-like protein [Phycisphaerales bacterium]